MCEGYAYVQDESWHGREVSHMCIAEKLQLMTFTGGSE